MEFKVMGQLTGLALVGIKLPTKAVCSNNKLPSIEFFTN